MLNFKKTATQVLNKANSLDSKAMGKDQKSNHAQRMATNKPSSPYKKTNPQRLKRHFVKPAYIRDEVKEVVVVDGAYGKANIGEGLSSLNDSPAESWQQITYFEVTEHQEGQRLDNFLIARLKGVPKSRIYRLIRENEVRVNKGRVQADRKLVMGDVVRVAPIRRQVNSDLPISAKISDNLAKGIAARIVYQDDGLIVLDKPSGIAVHGGSGVDFGVIETLRHALGKPYLELIHRIDRDTSGLLMISQKRSVLKRLQDDLREGRIQKTYFALLKGQVLLDEQVVDTPLLRYELANGERRVKVSSDGKASKTKFTVKQRFQTATLVEAKPFTGRTHQIRVHGLSIGHPLVGDDKYGHERDYLGAPARRLCLHAAQLEIPGYETIQSELPADMRELIKQL